MKRRTDPLTEKVEIMDKRIPIECLCPHCLSANQIKEQDLKNHQRKTVGCAGCQANFEIIIAKGLSGTHNVIVEDISR